jgi:hypothetical protein
VGTLKAANHYLIIILVMSRSLRKFLLTAVFSAFSLTLPSFSIQAATLLMITPPKVSVLDNPLLTSSYYDLYWVTIDPNSPNTITLAQSNKILQSIDPEDAISKVNLHSSSAPTSQSFKSDFVADKISDRLTNILANDNLLLVSSIFLLLVGANVFCLVFFDKQLMAFIGLESITMGTSGKPKVPNESVFLHNRLLQEIEKLAGRLQHLDNTKFTEAEFLKFLHWESNINKGKNEYKDLREPIQLLQVGLGAKNSFLALEQAEFRYRGSRQQEFYNYITQLLEQNLTKDKFKSEVEFKLTETLPTLMTEEGQQALISYSQELYKLAETNLALKLMLLFRQYKSQNYSIFKSIADVIEKTGEKNLLDPKIITSLVSFHFDDFEKVSKIIGLSRQYTTVDTYTKILQYLGLASRHSRDYYEFQELISIIKQWQKPYQSLTHIRQQYNSREYDLPKDFTQPIPGEKVVKKYHEFA